MKFTPQTILLIIIGLLIAKYIFDNNSENFIPTRYPLFPSDDIPPQLQQFTQKSLPWWALDEVQAKKGYPWKYKNWYEINKPHMTHWNESNNM